MSSAAFASNDSATRTVLIAGATGAIGRRIVECLRVDGSTTIRCLTRRTGTTGLDGDVVVGDALKPESIRGVADDVDVVVSALGASVGLGLSGRASYEAVDVTANLNLLREAQLSNVGRFVYIGVHASDGYDHTRYIRAHEAVCDALRDASISTTVIRPTGVFTALHDFLDMARRGRAYVMGDGSARTNPIHPMDVAEAVVAHLDAGPADVSVGGPQIMTRREIAEIAFEALGKPPKISSVPPAFVRTMHPMVRLFHPRLGDLIEFAVEVSTHDGVAPVVGHRTLLEYFRSVGVERKLLPGAGPAAG